MELKQLEYFIKCADYGSLEKASEKLGVHKARISRMTRSLETELGCPLFEPTSRGLKLTTYGQSIYIFALSCVKNAELISSYQKSMNNNVFFISTCQSKTVESMLARVYLQYPEVIMEHHNGTIDDIITQVKEGTSEMGVLYVCQKYLNVFTDIIAAKKLEFNQVAVKKACVYAGPKSPVYDRKTVSVEEITKLPYVRTLCDYFSLDDGTSHTYLGLAKGDALRPAVFTDSEYMASSLITDTDLTAIGIDLGLEQKNDMIRCIDIEGKENGMVLGYIKEMGRPLSVYGTALAGFLEELNT